MLVNVEDVRCEGGRRLQVRIVLVVQVYCNKSVFCLM